MSFFKIVNQKNVMGISRFLTFKVGQILWISLVSFLSFRLMFSVDPFKAANLAAIVVISAFPVRYFFLETMVSWGKWSKKDLERSVDLLRELIIVIVIDAIIFGPNWWFIREPNYFLANPEWFEVNNLSHQEFQLANGLLISFGIMVTLLITTIDNWIVFVQTRNQLSKNEL